MIRQHNIICFGSEGWEYPGFQQTTMRLFSCHNKVLYINPLGTRKISLSLSNLVPYFKRFRSFFNHKPEASENRTVCNPWIIPLVYSNKIMKINTILIRHQFTRLLPQLNFEDYILWVGTPTAASLLDLFNPHLLIYNPVDRFYAFPFVNSVKIRAYEKAIATEADVIICTSDAIRDDLLPYNRYSFTVSHGVDFSHFNSVFDIDTVPEDIKDIPKPIIGYFGGLSYRVNYRLLNKIAIRYPQASIVLIGKKSLNLGKFEKLPNVHILGFKNSNVLRLYLKQFSVCLIPYHVNDLMEGVDPIKLREYLCLGKPVVSVDLPEVRKFRGLVYIGETEEDFLDKVGEAIAEDNTSLMQHRICIAKQSDLSIKINEVSQIVYDAHARKESCETSLLNVK